MSRLTIRNSDGTVSQPSDTTVEAVFYQLAVFEDKLDAGFILETPFRVGTHVKRRDDGTLGVVEEIVFNADGLSLFVKGDNSFYAKPSELVLTNSTKEFGDVLVLNPKRENLVQKDCWQRKDRHGNQLLVGDIVSGFNQKTGSYSYFLVGLRDGKLVFIDTDRVVWTDYRYLEELVYVGNLADGHPQSVLWGL